MQRIFPLFFAAVALAVCAGRSYTITLHQPAMAGGTELKAGDHRVQLVDGNAVIIDGKAATRTPVKVETVSGKYAQTTVRLETDGGKARVQEIRLGGSNTRLVIAQSSEAAGTASGSSGGSGPIN